LAFKHGILTVGITGGIGAGKTTVCKIFEELGAKVIYADELAKEIMENDESLKKKIKKIFGEKSYIGENLTESSSLTSSFHPMRKENSLNQSFILLL
jgi:dephospho-CoA kinase